MGTLRTLEKFVGVCPEGFEYRMTKSKLRLVREAAPTFKVPYMQLVKILWCC
jgi:hypothetical protein